ncbi:MAG TPA: tRNA cyclic N6-threonylcarbamoyladenosine(37) synthase TcdA, partial [Thiotrichales bacterium]|nr:tRNA cyclic N6-threonylcarbamoyladenosine(37) synthase TcdA [Thiotrichales bacterium]
MSEFEEKFGSLSRLYGDRVLQGIRGSHVCVVGIGGVGSWAAEALARSGVGRLTLVDGDTISASNMNRQIHALDATLGQLKAEVMAQRIRQINADCQVRVIDRYIDDDNLRDILQCQPGDERYTAVIDAIDSI